MRMCANGLLNGVFSVHAYACICPAGAYASYTWSCYNVSCVYICVYTLWNVHYGIPIYGFSKGSIVKP